MRPTLCATGNPTNVFKPYKEIDINYAYLRISELGIDVSQFIDPKYC